MAIGLNPRFHVRRRLVRSALSRMATSEGMGGFSILAIQSDDEDVNEGLYFHLKKLTCALFPAGGSH